MNSLRTYGVAPFELAVVHGGPGGAGQMAPVARMLAQHRGVLEPLQTHKTIEGQIAELCSCLRESTANPVTVIGHSWGAVLCLLLAATHPKRVRKLVLIGCPPLTDAHVSEIMKTRRERLSTRQWMELDGLVLHLSKAAPDERDRIFEQLATLSLVCDSVDPLIEENEILRCEYAIYKPVMEEFVRLRHTDGFSGLVRQIRCPVVAMHGEADPHPACAVQEFLAPRLKHFQFQLLMHCGHYPWLERQTKAPFYDLLERALGRELLNETTS